MTRRQFDEQLALLKEELIEMGNLNCKAIDDAVGALDIRLTEEDVAFIDEPYAPHRIVGAL